MIRLIDLLEPLARGADPRPLVAALCRCVRLHPTSTTDPARRLMLDATEAWLTGGPTPDLERARHIPGGIFVAACVRSITADEVERIEIITFFAQQFPTMLWFATAHGRLWSAENDTPVGDDPEAMRAIAATEARLVVALEP